MPGITSWKVKKNGKYYNQNENGAGLSETMFPPGNISELNMERCIRIYPFQQNTGGFFIAVLQKVNAYGSIDSGKVPKIKKLSKRDMPKDVHDGELLEVGDKLKNETDGKKAKKIGWGGLNEEPFVFLDNNDPTLQECFEKYGLSQNKISKETFLVRCEESRKDYRHIYMVTDDTKRVLTSKNAEFIKVVNTGVKAFTRIGGIKAKGFRICNEAIQILGQQIQTDRLINISVFDLIKLISVEYPLFSELSSTGQNRMQSLGMPYNFNKV